MLDRWGVKDPPGMRELSCVKERSARCSVFAHSSDLHLVKPFGRFDNDLPTLLREAKL
ncbi:hypothetical protein EV216_11511 [Rhodovulum steppense]|uniref:Uncharacterized protein n=1 Tax=Rhodovulum steppense TaxID=540251 RepID=A0A4R1YSP1_9RHOB|nr:hypothetical protein EV216_11511 [Rhodovulum steppense]